MPEATGPPAGADEAGIAAADDEEAGIAAAELDEGAGATVTVE